MPKGLSKVKTRRLWRWFTRQWSQRRIPGLAAESAFWLFFALLPLSAVGGMVAAKIGRANATSWLPWLSSSPDAMRQLLDKELARVASWNSGAVGLFAALMFLWLGSSGFHALFDAFAAEVRRPRSWVRTRAAALLACGGLSTAIFFLVGIELVTAHLVPSWMLRAAELIWPFGVATALYRLGLAREHREHMPLAPGALFSAALQALVGWGYGRFILVLGDGSAYLAGLAGVGVTLTALFLYSLSLLLGLMLNEFLQRATRCRRVFPRAAWNAVSGTSRAA